MRHMRAMTTAATSLLAAAALTACGSGATTAASTPSPSATTSAPSQAEKLQAWFDNGGQAQIDTISGDLDGVTSGLDVTKMDKLATACAKLTSDVETLQTEKAIPDAKAASEWKLALDHLQSAASHCTKGAISEDPSEIEQTTAELEIGTNHVNTASDRLNAIRSSG